MANLKDMEGPIKFDKGVELYYDPKKDMFYDEKKKKYVKEKDIIKMVESSEDEDIEDIELTSDLEGNLFEALSRAARLQKSRQMKKMSKRMALKRKMKMNKSVGQDGLKKRARKMAINHLKKKLLKGRDISKLSSGEKEKLEDMIKKKTSSIKSLEAKFLKVVRQLEKDRRKNEEVELVEGRDEEYEKFFQSALKKFGVSSPSELKGDKKKEFFDYVDKNWEGESEEDEEETIEELNIGMSFAGNGLSVYDRDREESGDYMKIAHVQGKPNKKVQDGDDITLNIYDKKKSNHKAIISRVEKSFPKSKIKVDDRSKMKMTQEETIEEKEFKPHMMYDPKTGKAYKAEKPEDHERMSKLGYTHEKPKKVEEGNIEEIKIHPALRKLETALNKILKDTELDDLVPEYGAKIVDGKKVYHLEYKKGKKEGEEFAKSLQKALKASSFSVMPYRGDDSMVSIEIKEETVSPKMAAYLNFLNKNLQEGKSDYEIYHNTFSSAIDEVKKFAKKNGYELDDDDLFHTVGTGPKKPSTGKTNKYHLKLIKGGKENKKQLHFQVYGMKTQYELNMYIS